MVLLDRELCEGVEGWLLPRIARMEDRRLIGIVARAAVIVIFVSIFGLCLAQGASQS